MTTMAEFNKRRMEKYGTKNNTFEDFPIGTKVQVITPCEDFNFFYGETGKVIRNKGSYLSIIVEFDKPRKFKDGSIQKEFNFGPTSLYILKEGEEPFDTEKDDKEENEISNRFDILDIR